MDTDLAIRLAAFAWLAEKTEALGDVLPRTLLAEGFPYAGERIPLVAPQGIFKPRQMELPLSITTTPKGPYHDSFGPDGFLSYRYRGTDANHPDNVGLRKAIERRSPLIYLHGIVAGRYLAVWPVYVISDHPAGLSFTVAVDDMASLREPARAALVAESSEAKRAYLTATVRQRLHQRGFRERVLAAYRSQCALCRLRHRELLDAAHIIPDTAPEGEPAITNGIALCKLHHAAFDSFILGVSPDYVVHVREDVLNEHDGPVLQHALKELHGARLVLPSSRAQWPSREALEWRWERFRTP